MPAQQPPPQLAGLVSSLLPYVPRMLSLASEAPAFLFGYAIAFIYFVVWVGPAKFKTHFAPISGFHMVSIILCGLFWRSVAVGYKKVLAVRRRKDGANSIVADLLLLSHEPKLD